MASLQTVSSINPHTGKANEDASLWFFFTLMSTLPLLFGLTFRYYSHRETKEVERRWERACQRFLARMEVEGTNSENRGMDHDTIWARILRGEGVEASEVERIPTRKRRDSSLG
ncbi:MAG: hypothetical protein ACE5OR_01860 [bacterium]